MAPRQQQSVAPKAPPVQRHSQFGLSRRELLSQVARLALAGMLMLLAILMPSVVRADGPEAWQVSGTMEESTNKTGTNAYGTATGDLAGPYKVKFISEATDGNTVTVLSRRTIDTEDGTLVLDEVGTVDLTTLAISVVSTVRGGNGIFQKATGTLYLGGQENANGTVTFTYSGTIDLVD